LMMPNTGSTTCSRSEQRFLPAGICNRWRIASAVWDLLAPAAPVRGAPPARGDALRGKRR
jgi:hypothetical protein